MASKWSLLHAAWRRSRDISLLVSSSLRLLSQISKPRSQLTESGPELVQKVGVLYVHLSALELEEYRVSTWDGRSTGIKFDFVVKETMGSAQESLIYRAVTMDNKPLGEAQVRLPALE